MLDLLCDAPVYGRWTVIREFKKRAPNGHLRILCECRCVCGKVRNIRKTALTSGHAVRCLSCANSAATGENSVRWAGCGELTGYIWSSIRTNAKRRSLALIVTVEQAWELYLKQKRRCALTGQPIDFVNTSRWKQGLGTASLDRKDSSKPYTLDNVQWVHKDVNMMKRDLPDERFIEICRMVVKHRGA